MMKTKQCAHHLSRSHKVRQRVPFLDEARRIMSKIWSLLRCIRAIRNMLRNSKWCILMDETCFVVKCTHVKFSFAIPPFLLSLSLSPTQLLANKREVLDGDTAVPRRGLLVDPWRCVGIVSADHSIERAVRRVNVHKTSASRPSSVRRTVDNLNVDTQGDRLPIWSSGAAVWRWRHENQVATSSRRRSLVCASPLQHNKQSMNHALGNVRKARPTHEYRR